VVGSGGRAYKWKIVVRILELGIIGVDFVDEKGDCFAIFVALDGPTCQSFSAHCPQADPEKSLADIPGM
jgi:hypothetical protein